MFTHYDTVHTHFDIVNTHFGTVHTLFTCHDTVRTHLDKVHTHLMLFAHLKFSLAFCISLWTKVLPPPSVDESVAASTG